MHKIILLASLLCSATFSSFGQDTLFAADVNMTIGETFALKICNPAGVSPGSAGASVTWDFSSLVTSSDDTGKAVAPTATPYFASFPTTNVAFTGPGVLNGAITYVTTSSSALQQDGYYSAPDTNLIMSDPMDQLRYPMYVTQTYSDPFTGVLTLGPLSASHNGTLNVTCDGRGTLILPGRTDTAVFRVNSTQNYTDSINLFGTPVVKSYVISSYNWYKKATHTALLTIQTVTEVGHTSPDFEFVGYMAAKLTATPHLSTGTIAAQLFPNPASGTTNIQFTAPGTGAHTEVVLCDITGKAVKVIADKQFSGRQLLNFDVSDLSAGNYVVRISSGTEQASLPLVIK